MATIKTSIQIMDGMTPAFKSMSKVMETVIDSFETLQIQSGRAIDTSSMQRAKTELQKINNAFNGVEDSINDAKNNQDKFNQSVRNGTTASNSLLSTVKKVAVAVGGLAAVKGVVNLSDTLTQTKARLDLMNDGLQTTEELQKMIFASAQRSRGAYLGTADAVGKMGIMAKDAFKSNAELIAFVEQVNKQFTIAGTSAEGISAAMLQLTQAMGSGVLRGEELNSIFEQAPTIIQTVADYLGVSIGQIREMASEGQITAQVVKNALLAAAEETNAKFESMPKTWAQLWQSFTNQAIMAFQPILDKLNLIFNSEKFQTFFNVMLNGLQIIATVATYVFDAFLAIFNVVAENWSLIAPIIMGVVGVLALYYGWLGAIKLAEMTSAAVKTLMTGATFLYTLATQGQAAALAIAEGAQWGLNTAILASPVFWIIAAIILLIAAVYGVVAAYNHWTDSTVSATGIICGCFMWLVGVIWNIVAWIWNAFVALCEFLANCFVDPVWAIKSLLAQIAIFGINVCIWIYQAFDAMGVNIAGIFQALGLGIVWVFTSIWNAGLWVAEGIANFFVDGVNCVIVAINGLYSAFLTICSYLEAGWYNFTQSLGDMIIDGLNMVISGLNWFIDKVNSIPGVEIGNLSSIGGGGSGRKFGQTYSEQLISEIGKVSLDSYKADVPTAEDFSNAFNYTNQDAISSLESLKNGINDWVGEKPENAVSMDEFKLDYKDLSAMYDKGYQWGSEKEDAVTGWFDNLLNGDLSGLQDLANVGTELDSGIYNVPTIDDLGGLSNLGNGSGSGGSAGGSAGGSNGLGGSANNIKDSLDNIDGNTAALVDAMGGTSEDLKYIRNLAEREIVNRFTTAEIKIDMNNNNTISSEMDLDGVVTYLTGRLQTEMETLAEGVHA